MTGFTNEELVGMDGLKLIAPDWLDLVLKNIKSGYDQPYEVEGVRKDGSAYPLAIRGKNIPYKGREVRVIEFRDISARKQAEMELRKSEAKQRAMIENIVDVIAIVDQDGINRFKSPNVERWFGWKPEEIVGVSTWDNIHPDDLKGTQQVFADMLSKADATVTAECRYRCKDGSYKWIEFTAVNRLHDPDISGALLSYHDITDRKHAEEQRQKLENQLQQAQKMEAVGTLAGGIAHDFNNLLAIMSGNIDVIQHKHMAGNSSEENVEHIKNSISQAKNLVMQILAFSRQEEPELAPVDLSMVVGDVLNLFRSTIPATVEIAATVDSGPIVVNADKTQFQQIFINLCTNAVHAMEEKGVLRVKWEGVELAAQEIPGVADHQTGRYAKLSISDTGTGMEKETIARIFDPFFTTKGVGSGTGMGLSVVHGIVDQHGGFITVDSTLGQGTTFTIYFPTIRETGAVQKTNTAESLPTGTERILFVDDEECIADTCGELLEYQGYKVTSTTSSIEALEIFKASPDEFDLIFTDQTMPEMSGAEMAAEMLKIRPDISIILCSGYSAKVSEGEAKGIGIREFAMKPMDMKQLAIVARKVLDESGRPV